jgi:leader peptidase (prepilin peptidase)/N-methyltransferase
MVAAGVALAGWLAAGLFAAVPAGAGLVAAAATDLATHRFSVRALGVASALVALALIFDAAASGAWSRLGFAAAGTAVSAVLLIATWVGTRGLAFGDVLLVTFAVAVPLYVSALAAAVALGAASLAAAGLVAMRAAVLGADRPATVPLAPALLVGWLVGLVVG